MRKIRVTVGTVGYFDGGHHKTKTTSDKPFECEDAQAAHFVECGVAEYVDQEQEKGHEPEQQSEPEAAHLDAAQLEAMTNDQLKNLAGDLGIDVTGCKKKADFVAAIVAADVEPGPADDEDELPDLTAADPE